VITIFYEELYAKCNNKLEAGHCWPAFGSFI